MREPKPILETEEQKRNRETVESIARNIASLARAVDALLKGQLKRRAIVLLLSQSSGIGRENVDKVLTALTDLEKDWLNK